jgi:hypothetical protein
MTGSSTVWQAVSAIATLLVGAAVAFLAFQANDLTKASQQQLELQQRAQAANRVYLGEAPPDTDISKKSSRPDIPILAVINTSSVEISNVWVQGRMSDGRGEPVDLVFYDIPSCTLYTIQDNVTPSVLHFTDSVGHWRRIRGQPPVLDKADGLPPKNPRHPPRRYRHWDSGTPNTIPGCNR